MKESRWAREESDSPQGEESLLEFKKKVEKSKPLEAGGVQTLYLIAGKAPKLFR